MKLQLFCTFARCRRVEWGKVRTGGIEDVYLVRCAEVGDVVGADVVSERFEAAVVSRAWCED